MFTERVERAIRYQPEVSIHNLLIFRNHNLKVLRAWEYSCSIGLKNVIETSASLTGVFITKAQQHAREPRVYPPPQLNLEDLQGKLASASPSLMLFPAIPWPPENHGSDLARCPTAHASGLHCKPRFSTYEADPRAPRWPKNAWIVVLLRMGCGWGGVYTPQAPQEVPRLGLQWLGKSHSAVRLSNFLEVYSEFNITLQPLRCCFMRCLCQVCINKWPIQIYKTLREVPLNYF